MHTCVYFVSAVFGLGIGLVSFLGTFLIARFAPKLGLIDLPNSRSLHRLPTPRGGGVAIVLIFLISVVFLGKAGYVEKSMAWNLVSGGGLLAVVGFIDDRQGLSAGSRFVAHLIAALFTVFALGGVPLTALLNWVWIGSFVAIGAIVWSINLFNFMDGIDGLAASEAIFIAGSGACLNWMLDGRLGVSISFFFLATACAGFLFWNWPKASIFLGDSGSAFLGFALATLALTASRTGPLPVQIWPILGGVFFVDATTTLLRRVLRRERWFEAHRCHAYQRLALRWDSHVAVTLSVCAINVFWLLPWAFFVARAPSYANWSACAALLPVIAVDLIAGAGTAEVETAHKTRKASS